ncbi:sulfurtransferase [Raineyella sp. LH-20]|uniref:sulfurtransferase n=1 Tax=Raineyella sp. LH-20 TaxID=3081204 RepID=UPI002952DCB0|nr:sulfurtransferase [Raineyella sp. LH-20]WOP17395.1 sulfurtransferase [Raineyella sp. LH-20]
MRVLISAQELGERISCGEAPVLLDVRWVLGDPYGQQQYREGHIPGAVYVDLNAELAAPAHPLEGRHPLPDPADLQAAARRWGLRDGDTVVAYDASGAMAAARAWWLLRWAGFGAVQVLDGGLAAWRAAGLPLEAGEVTPAPGDVVLGHGQMPVIPLDGVLAAAEAVLLDARAGERFRGETEPIDPYAGHIPGAVSAPTGDNLGPDGCFLPAVELRRRFEALGVRDGVPVGVYCGSGVTAAHEIAALAIAGFDAALYPGSWSQWSNHEELPRAVGAEA